MSIPPDSLLLRLRDEVQSGRPASRFEIRNAEVMRMGTPLGGDRQRGVFGAICKHFGTDLPPDWTPDPRTLVEQTPPPGKILLRTPISLTFADKGARHELKLFYQQSEEIAYYASRCLALRGIDYRERPITKHTWPTLCYFLAWDFPEGVTYRIHNMDWTDRKSEPPGPFTRDRFEAWEEGRSGLPDGYYIVSISRDIRGATVSAIDLILGMPSVPEPHPSGLDAVPPPNPQDVPTAETRLEVSAPHAAKARRKKHKNPGEARGQLILALDSLIENGPFGMNKTEIIEYSGITRCTFYSHDDEEEVRDRLARYTKLSRQKRGVGPRRANQF